jgi:murein DD-endopeptidase MepM/ murein hydrolase activator NlpD
MSKSAFRGALPLALLAAFAAGAALDGWLRTYGPPKPAEPDTEQVRLTDSAGVSSVKKPDTPGKAAVIAAPRVPPPSSAVSSPPPSSTVSGASPSSVASGFSRTTGMSRTSGTSGALPSSHLRLPIDGANIESFKGGFAEKRGSDRPHEAVDMLAPRNTPVHAVENGTIAKLFTSKAGGLTIYQFDPSGHFCYYYAHLARYADGLKDGQAVSQGDIIGYVGTSGNAPANTPHLHFAVFELNADKHWWQGKAIDPYRVFKDRG